MYFNKCNPTLQSYLIQYNIPLHTSVFDYKPDGPIRLHLQAT